MENEIKKLIEKYADKRTEEPLHYFEWIVFIEDLQSLQKLYKSQCEKSLVIAFVQGASWWEYHKTKATMWMSDKNLAEEEAVSRLINDTLGKTVEEIINENAKNKIEGGMMLKKPLRNILN